jgi:hypothetical protein
MFNLAGLASHGPCKLIEIKPIIVAVQLFRAHGDYLATSREPNCALQEVVMNLEQHWP